MSKKNNNYSSSSNSNISMDSLEVEFIRKTSIRDNSTKEKNVDTILVPFYEKDVLIKVPIDQQTRGRRLSRKDITRAESKASTYLVNKQKAKRSSYLEMFRKQLTPHQKNNTGVENEIRSLSPEVGDTERDSINEGEDPQHPVTEFYNTESYNEIYYEKLMTHEYENYIDDGEMQYSVDVDVGGDKSPRDLLIDNLRSVSEVSQEQHRIRRASTGPPLDNMKLGGLGPDVEVIKPRLERARSLQRYSEKVRMENRLKIYKNSVKVENDKKTERVTPAKQINPEKEEKATKVYSKASYLMKKSDQQKQSSHILNKLYSKSNSADGKKNKNVSPQTPSIPRESSARTRQQSVSRPPSAKEKNAVNEVVDKARVKSSTKSRGINTIKSGVPPVQINFMVNMGGVRPSSALKNLEEKHRIYQEQVKAFKMSHND